MPFNHYARLKRILEQQPNGWFIRRINEPTQAKNFRGEVVRFTHYYRLYDHEGLPLKFGKFQQIERLAQALGEPVEGLPITDM